MCVCVCVCVRACVRVCVDCTSVHSIEPSPGYMCFTAASFEGFCTSTHRYTCVRTCVCSPPCSYGWTEMERIDNHVVFLGFRVSGSHFVTFWYFGGMLTVPFI